MFPKILFTLNRCIDHSMHRAAFHFIKALGIPSLMKTKKTLRTRTAEDDDMEAEDAKDEDVEE